MADDNPLAYVREPAPLSDGDVPVPEPPRCPSAQEILAKLEAEARARVGEEDPKPAPVEQRFRFRFSFAQLMLTTTVIAVALGVMKWLSAGPSAGLLGLAVLAITLLIMTQSEVSSTLWIIWGTLVALYLATLILGRLLANA